MGTCSSKDQIEKSVVSPPRSPPRPRSNNVNVPNTSSSPLPDARHEYSTVADHQPRKPKDNKDDEDDDDHPFFPHEAETPEVLSARSSTDDEKSNTDGKLHTSSAFESSEEYATSKELQVSAHPGSLPDDYHDALDKFGKSLTDSHTLKSETNPLHESKSVKNDARPFTSRSFTERKPISKKSLKESKQEPLHSAAAPSKEAKALAKAFATREESHRSTAIFAAPEEVGNLSTRDTAEAREAVASIQGQAKVPEITPALETATELAAMTSSAVKDKETMEYESTNVKYAQETKSTNADEQPSVSIPGLTEKGERSTAPATDIAANLPTTDSKETTESIVETEKCDEESHTDQYANATKEEDGANGTAIKGVRLIKLGCSDIDNRDFHRKSNTDEQKDLSYINLCREPTMAQTPNAAQVVENFPTKNDAMLAGQTIPLEESQKKIITDPATDETMEPDVLNNYQVKQDARIGEPEISHVENVITTKIRSIDQQETVLSPAMEDRHEESHRNPATVTTTKDVGILPTKENEQTAYLTVSINKQQKESNRALASDVTKEGIILQIDAATEDKGMGHESSNKGNVEKTESTVEDEQQLTLSPALEEQHEKLQATPCINEVKDGEMLHTRNNAWETNPTKTSEELHKVLDPTATDATIEVAATALNTAAQGKFIDNESIKVGKTEEIASIYDEKKQDTPPTMEEQGEDPYPAPATNAVTGIANPPMMDRTKTTLQIGEHHKLSCTTTTHEIKEDILADNIAAEAVLDVENECKDIKNEQKNKNIDVDEQLNVSSPPLKEKYEESDTAQPAISALELIKTFNAKEKTKELKQIILQKELFNTASVIDATMEATNEEREDAKVEKLKSSGVQDLKEPETRSIDHQETVSYPVHQTEESYRSPVNVPVTKVDGMLPTNNSTQTTDLTITTDEKHKESSRAPDANVKTEEDALLINVARETKGLEHEKNNGENAERTQSTSAEQQSNLSPALEEQHEESQTCSDINAAKEVPETVHMKENAWEADLMIPSEELHDHSHMEATEIKIEADVIAIKGAAKSKSIELEGNDVENAQKPISLCVNKEQLHFPPDIEEQGQETDPDLDTDGVTEIDENFATVTGTHISGIQELKETESRIIDEQATISYPSLVDQTEESHRSPVILLVTKVDGMFPTNNEVQTTDENQKETRRAPDYNVTPEEDALLVNAAKEAEGLEHESNIDKNTERTNAEQQSTLSPALEEQHEDPQTCSDINAAKEIFETVHRKENACKTDPMIPFKDLHDQSHTEATETKIEEDAISINGVEKGEAMELERNKVENAQEPAGLCVKQEQSHSPPAVEEQGQETDPTLDPDGVTEVVESLATINVYVTHIMGVQDLKEPESRSIDQQETILYPSLVYQTEESQRNPVIVPVTEVDGMFPTNNEARTTDLPITTDEKHKESSRAPDANVRTEEDTLLINAAREPEGLEHERNNDKNAERTETTNAEQQPTLSPVLEEQHEDSQTCSEINAANEIPENVQRKENAQEADPVISSEELHDQSHTAATETKLEEDAIAINGVEKSETTVLESNNVENAQEQASLCVNKEQSHSPPAIEEQSQETDPALDTDGVTEIVENLDTITGTHISGIQDLKEPENRSIDQQETISYPSLVDQTEESHRSPVIIPVTKVDGMSPTNNEAQTKDLTITTDENQKESKRAPDDNARTEEDALLVNAAREAEGLEHQRNIGKNAQREESTNAEQQSTLSPALGEEHEDSRTCSDINAAKEISETVHRKENACEADPMIPSKELHDQSHTAATETKIDEDAIAINGVEKGEATELESNKVENAQEPAGLCVNQEQSHSPPAVEEQGQETDPTLDPDGVTEVVESLATINGTHIMGVQDLKEPESRSIDQQETISYPSLVYQTEESQRNPVIVPVTEVDGMFPTNNEARTTDLPITTDEKHKESSRDPDANMRTEEDALLVNAAIEPEGLEHERNNDENAERTETTNAEQQSTLSPASEEQHEDSQTCSEINAANEIPETVHRKENARKADPVIPSEELHDQLHSAATETKLEEDAIAINGVEKGETMELESNNVENVQEPASLCVNKEQSYSPPAIEEQAKETDPALDTHGVTEIVESLDTITGTHINGIQDLKEPENRSIDQQETFSYPSLVDEAEESHRSPVIIPVTKVDGISPTNNEAQTKDWTRTTDENQKESRRAPDNNVSTEEDALLVNAAREAKVLEHERNIDKNAQRAERTNAEQQLTLSPTLEEHEDAQTCSDINAATEISETVHRKENAWEADPMIPSKELHDQSHTATTETKMDEDAISINGVEKVETTELESNKVDNESEEDLTIDSEALHKQLDITASERKIEVDVTAINEVSEREVAEVKSNKVKKTEEPASKYVDGQQSTSPAAMEEQIESDLARATNVVNEIAENPSMMDETTTVVQTENHHKESNITPLIRDDAHTAEVMLEMAKQDKEYSRAPAIDAIKEHKSVEHESDNGENAEKNKTTGEDKQPSSLSPTLEEKHEESKLSPYINAATEVPKTNHMLDNASASDLIVVSEELHKRSYTTNSEREIEMDVKSTNGVTEGNMAEIESNKVEKAELASKYVDKQQSHSPAAMEEQVEDSDSAPANRAVKEIAENLPMVDETTTAVQTEKHHKESNITTLTDLARNVAQTADLMVGMAEQDKESSRAPATDAIIEDKGVEHKSDHGKNTEKAETTGADEQPSTLSPALEEHEELESSLYINAPTEVPETLYTWDNASEADLILATNKLDKHSDTTSDGKIEVDLTASDEVAERKVVDEKSNEEEKAKEPESKYVDKEQSHSPTAIEEKVEDSDLVPAINAVKEIEENLAMMDETPTAVQTGYQHKDSNITLLMDSTKDEDVLANNIAVKVVEVAEIEDKVVENEKKHENADADEWQSVSSPVLKENWEETDATQTTDTAPEAVETFTDEQQNFSSSVLKEHEETNTTEATDTAPEVVETFADEQQSISSSLLKENCEETDIAQATVTAQEAVENFDTNDNEMVTKETMEVKEPHKQINMTLITNATTKAGVENIKKHENVDADQQQSVSSPILEEKSEETDTTQATNTAPEAVETFGDELQKFSSFALKECEETDTTEATDTEPEAAETFNNEQQSISSSVLKENFEEAEIAQATDTAPEAVENSYVNENAMVVKEPHKEFNMTSTTNATTEAGVENEKKHENTDADKRQSVSSTFLKEKCEETDTTLATNTAQEAVETFVDEQKKFSPPVLKECEEANTSEATDTAQEAVEAFADEQQSTPSSVFKENCEETNIAQDTDTAPEAVEKFYANDNAMVAKESMAVKEPHKEFNMTLITNTTTDADVPTMDEIKENAKVQELEISSDEIIKEPESRWFDHQKSFLSSALEEQKESHTSLVNSGSTEIVRILPTKNDAQTADLMMPTEEQHEQSNKAPATNVTIEADSLLINAATEEGYVGHESSHVENEKEMITTGPHEQHSTLSPALVEQHAESEASPAIKEATEICETIDTWDIAQTQESMIQSEQHHEESDTTSPHETTGIDVITIKAIEDDEVVELESSKVEKADELASIYVEKQQAHSPPTMREQDEESNPILATNAAIEILKNHPTKDVAQTTDPTVSSEQQFNGSDKTPVGDVTIEDLEDVQQIKALSKDAQSMGCVTKNIDIAECPDTYASKEQTASFPTSKEECEESDIVQPSKATTQSVDTFDSRNDAETADHTVPREGKEKEPHNTPTTEETRDNDIAMGTITEDIKVGGLESSDVENLEEIDSTGAGQQHIVLSTYTFPARSAATEIVEALATGNNPKQAELMVQTKEWQKESESTLTIDAPRETGSFVVDTVLDDKLVEQESNNIQNVEEGRSTNVYKKQPFLSPVREERHEESQIMSDTNALTEIAQIRSTKDKAQITDPIEISEEVYEASHTTPTIDPKSAIDDIAIKSITVGEAVQLKDSNLENEEEQENEMADEQQRVSSQALEEKLGHSNIAKPTTATMEIDESTGTRNIAQTEEMRAPTEKFDITEKNTEAEILAIDRITEDVTDRIIRSTTVKTPEENSPDVNQLSVLCQNLEEHLAASAAVSAHCEIKETADALLTSENTWTIYETVPIEEKHEKPDISPATNETTEP